MTGTSLCFKQGCCHHIQQALTGNAHDNDEATSTAQIRPVPVQVQTEKQKHVREMEMYPREPLRLKTD